MSEQQLDPTAELEALLTRELSGKGQVEAPEEAPEIVRDEPPGKEPELPTPELPTTPESPPEGEPEGEPEEPEEEGDPDTAWAKKKYGDDPEKWARAARHADQHISTLTNEKHASDQLAQQWYEYAQQQEQQQRTFQGGMPLSAQEEQWVEGAMTNPVEAARQAAFNGRVPLFHAVIGRVADENPQFAAQISAQIQLELQNWATQQAQQQQPQQATLEQALGGSLQRLGININRDGPRMSEKIGELGEYHPYVRAILEGSDMERDLAVQAVHDLTRASTISTRQVQAKEAVAKEEELRREAMVVQTGSMQPPAPPRQRSKLEQGMEEEWRRSGAWPYEEE